MSKSSNEPPISVTIAGRGLSFTPRYHAGHVLTAGEARALSAALVRRGVRGYRRVLARAKNEDEGRAAVARMYAASSFVDEPRASAPAEARKRASLAAPELSNEEIF